jgi:hypothetical protein
MVYCNQLRSGDQLTASWITTDQAGFDYLGILVITTEN